MTGLDNREKRMLSVLQSRDSPWHLDEVLKACQWEDQALVATAGHGLTNHGLVETHESSRIDWRLGEEGLAAKNNGLLEKRIWDWLKTQTEPTMAGLSSHFGKQEAGPGIGLMKNLGVRINAGILIWDDHEVIEETIAKRQNFIEEIHEDEEMISHFQSRKNLIEAQEIVTRTWQITQSGKEMPTSDLIEKEIVTDLSPELLQQDDWQDMAFKPFDVSLEASMPRTGKSHPMQALIERIRSIFLEMGFSEMVENYVQPAGWNMDALFIPQDHPAREMQDTFYLTNPEMIPIPDELTSTWKSIHETGGETDSVGWGGSFDENVSKKGLLRTHTTVNTIQYLHQKPTEPCRVFAVDRVFRKESIDRTHLPEFHQIEGIIMEEGANLPMLVNTLKTFYAKMGIDEVRVRPAYFPYTEPSLEIEVKWKGKWLELGGAGIFRPEVTEPLGCKWPVCAWGMGLERLAMLVLGLDDIRQLYISDLAWLSEQPVL